MAMNSSVTVGRMVQTTSSVWLACENLTGSLFVRPSYFHMKKNNAHSVAMNTTPVNHRMNMNNWSITRPCSETSRGNQMWKYGATTNVATPNTGTSRNTMAQKRFTANS